MSEHHWSGAAVLLLHGVTGGWDEVIILAAGVILAVVVVKWTNRSAKQAGDDVSMSTPDSTGDPPSEKP